MVAGVCSTHAAEVLAGRLAVERVPGTLLVIAVTVALGVPTAKPPCAGAFDGMSTLTAYWVAPFPTAEQVSPLETGVDASAPAAGTRNENGTIIVTTIFIRTLMLIPLFLWSRRICCRRLGMIDFAANTHTYRPPPKRFRMVDVLRQRAEFHDDPFLIDGNIVEPDHCTSPKHDARRGERQSG
jgi:hypothetical protein